MELWKVQVYHLNVLGRKRPRDGGLSRFPQANTFAVIEKIRASGMEIITRHCTMDLNSGQVSSSGRDEKAAPLSRQGAVLNAETPTDRLCDGGAYSPALSIHASTAASRMAAGTTTTHGLTLSSCGRVVVPKSTLASTGFCSFG